MMESLLSILGEFIGLIPWLYDKSTAKPEKKLECPDKHSCEVKEGKTKQYKYRWCSNCDKQWEGKWNGKYYEEYKLQ